MTTLTTDRFIAERQRNGDVWITIKGKHSFRDLMNQPFGVSSNNEFVFIVSKDKCKSLAELIWPNPQPP